MDDHDLSEVQALHGIATILAAHGLEVTETTSADGLPIGGYRGCFGCLAPAAGTGF